VFREEGLEVVAGIRQPLARAVDADPTLRLVEPAFMQIRQAIAARRALPMAARQFMTSVIGELRADGFVAQSLERSGQDPAVAA
jgi:polar amino acid transport system substrate-binding protein